MSIDFMWHPKRFSNPKRVISLSILASCCSILGLAFSTIFSATSIADESSTLTPSERRRLDLAGLATAEAAAEMEQLKLRIAAAESVFPELPSTPPASAFTPSTLDFESTILAYGELENVVSQVISGINCFLYDNQECVPSTTRRKIALVLLTPGTGPQNPSSVGTLPQDLIANELFTARVQGLIEDYKLVLDRPTRPPASVTTPSPRLPASPLIAPAAGFLLNLLPLFRTDNIFQGANVNISNNIFMAELSSQLRSSGRTAGTDPDVLLFNPAAYPLIDVNIVKQLDAEFSELEELRNDATALLNELNGQISTRNLEPEQLTKLSSEERQRLAEDRQKIADITDINKRFSALANDISLTGNSVLESVVRGRILNSLRDDGSRELYFLSLEIVAGGTNRISRSLFTSRLRHSGGALVTYSLYDSQNSRITFSDNLGSYSGFTKVEEFDRLDALEVEN